MQSVNYRCHQCGNFMAVELHSVGTAIDCPQCQHAMQPFVPDEKVPTEMRSVDRAAEIHVHEQESIFHGSEESADDLFGEPVAPRMELPSDAEGPAETAERQPTESAGENSMPGVPDRSPENAIALQLEAPVGDGAATANASQPCSAESVPTPAVPEAISAMVPAASCAVGDLVASQAEPAGVQAPPIIREANAASARDSGSLFDLSLFSNDAAPAALKIGNDSATALEAEPFVPPPARRIRSAAPMRSGLFILLVIVPLVSYSIFATIALTILYTRPPQPSLEYLPDVEGDFRGAKRQQSGVISYQRLDPDTNVPNRLRVRLGQTIRLGDVALAPEQIELARVLIALPDGGAEPAADDSLIVHYSVQNISTDVVFCPTDPYFDRQWKSDQEDKPYTLLEAHGRRFYGGALPWRSGPRHDASVKLEGQAYQVLKPGELVHTFACTDPGDHVGGFLASYHGPLLYRIQVRRGLVQVAQREVSATAVVGIDFRDTDIRIPHTAE